MEGDPDTFQSVQWLTQSVFSSRIPYLLLPPFSPHPFPPHPPTFPLSSVPSHPLFRSLLPFSLFPTSLSLFPPYSSLSSPSPSPSLLYSHLPFRFAACLFYPLS